MLFLYVQASKMCQSSKGAVEMGINNIKSTYAEVHMSCQACAYNAKQGDSSITQA